MHVLILVVMDDALVPNKKDVTSNQSIVLILVVMDDALVPHPIKLNDGRIFSLNPCCNG